MTRILFGLLVLISINSFAQQQASDSASIISDSSRPELLGEVMVRGRKPPVQIFPDKTIINVDASVTNAGNSIFEVLEKSPGVTIDKNGNISLKGRQGVLIMIDGKPTNITGGDLNNLLSGMAASQVEQIELIDNPPAKYDAAGNAGVINIKTKKNLRRGFNGNVNLSMTQGKYNRTFNSVGLNYSNGKFNIFGNITFNYNRTFSNLYAFRQYYEQDNKTITSLLEQPSYFKGRGPSQTVKAGLDYKLSKRSTLGMVVSETTVLRKGTSNNTAVWMKQDYSVDSVISTRANNRENVRNMLLNVNGRHTFTAGRELTFDLDYLRYRIRNNQSFTNTLRSTWGYEEVISGNLPSNLDIATAKADYSHAMTKGFKLESGWKSSHIRTNNKAAYFIDNGDVVIPDYSKTNNFQYREVIHAAYTSLEKEWNGWHFVSGLRYENTSYNAEQLGNEVRKDSSFSRTYDGFFPSMTVTFNADSNHSFSLTAGRRIDRPPFQSLNPFIFVINKYTYESGNPFYRPQYTWNFEVSHTFKNKLVSSLSYSRTKDYFSQIFTQDSTGIITYSVGNLDFMENFGASFSLQTSITPWWSVTGFTALNYKKIKGFVWDERQTARLQANFNINQQFIFGKGWTGEIQWIQQLHEQELQEITDPSGQVAVGIGKQVFKNKGTIKVAYRDIFYTMWMKGFTVFNQSTEYFKITRDSRAVSLSFAYRFGSSNKSVPRNPSGGAEEERNRVQE